MSRSTVEVDLAYLNALENERDGLVKERNEMLQALREITERMRRCDYTQARSDMINFVLRFPEAS